MKLEELIAAGSLAPITFVEKEVTWDGKTFTVKIKSEQTPADFEYIYLPKSADDSFVARRVHRYVLLEDDKQIPYEKACLMKADLLHALAVVINEVHEGKQEKKS